MFRASPPFTLLVFIVAVSLYLAPKESNGAPSRKTINDPPSSSRSKLYEFTPARPGESLEKIASYLIPDPAVSVEQMAWALFLKNPTAFIENNINSIKPLATLSIPTLEEIQSISHVEARLIIAGHHRTWAKSHHHDTLKRDSEEVDSEPTTAEITQTPFTIDAAVDIQFDHRRGHTLGDENHETLDISSYVYTGFNYKPTDRLTYYLELEPYFAAQVLSVSEDTWTDYGVELGSAWVYIDGLAGDDVGIQIGRQYFGDTRQWWWDANLNAVRFHAWGEPTHLHLGIGANPTLVSTTSGRRDPEERDVIWLLGQISWEWANDHTLEFFAFSRLDRSDTPQHGEIVAIKDADYEDVVLNWLGLRSMGYHSLETLGTLHYWMDLGIVYGNETLIDFEQIDDTQSVVTSLTRRNIDGWGLDIGASWETQLPAHPHFTLAYAMGSGDPDPSDDIDRNYRQSGLHNNHANLYGDTTYHYYGEILNPELSNLWIATLAIGFPLWEDGSINVVYHKYQQVYASEILRNTQLYADPNGHHFEIGQEIGIIAGLTTWRSLNIKLVAAQFRAGKAFGIYQGKTASRVRLELGHSF